MLLNNRWFLNVRTVNFRINNEQTFSEAEESELWEDEVVRPPLTTPDGADTRLRTDKVGIFHFSQSFNIKSLLKLRHFFHLLCFWKT